MFSSKFDQDIYKNLKSFFQKRKANRYRSSIDSGGSDAKGQVVENIESSNEGRDEKDGVLTSSSSPKVGFDNNIDIVELADDSQKSGNFRLIFKKVFKKLKKVRKDNKDKKDQLEQYDAENLEYSGQDPHLGNRKNVRENKTVENLRNLIKKVAARQALNDSLVKQNQNVKNSVAAIKQKEISSQKNILHNKDRIRQEEPEKTRETKTTRDNSQKNGVASDAKETNDKTVNEANKKMIGHFKNDLGMRGNNPIKALADSAVKGEAGHASKVVSAAATSAVAGNWVNKLDGSHDIEHGGGREF